MRFLTILLTISLTWRRISSAKDSKVASSTLLTINVAAGLLRRFRDVQEAFSTGFVWITVNASKIQTALTGVSPDEAVDSKEPGGSHPARFRACGLLMRKKSLSLEDWVELHDLLMEYMEDVGQRVLVLYREADLKFKFMRYRHRFLKRELRSRLNRYECVWKVASTRYSEGVFIT